MISDLPEENKHNDTDDQEQKTPLGQPKKRGFSRFKVAQPGQGFIKTDLNDMEDEGEQEENDQFSELDQVVAALNHQQGNNTVPQIQRPLSEISNYDPHAAEPTDFS